MRPSGKPVNKCFDYCRRTPQTVCMVECFVHLAFISCQLIMRMLNVQFKLPYKAQVGTMSRRKNRYNNRQVFRTFKKLLAISDCDTKELLLNYSNLYEAAKLAAKGVRWKESVQRYMLNACFNFAKTRQLLLKNKPISMGFIEFDLCDRGKLRHIKSVHFFERVIQKTLCKNILAPILHYNLIYANSASQKNKGAHFAVKQALKHLRKYYKQYGVDGYVLLMDFKSYFENINHIKLKTMINFLIKDDMVLRLIYEFIEAFGENGLGLGSETSQIHAVAYPNVLDHFITNTLGIKYYGRYMDDSYIIVKDKQELLEVKNKIQIILNDLGIKLSPNKTSIIKLSKGFTFLKTRMFLQSTGKIICKPCRTSITKERRKLKKQARLVLRGEMTLTQLGFSYVSWRGSMKNKNARKTVYNMDKLYYSIVQQIKEKQNNEQNIRTGTRA